MSVTHSTRLTRADGRLRMATKRIGLARRRKLVGYSQEQLAERLSVDRATVARWERGETNPQPWFRPRLARELRISAEELDDLLTTVDAMEGDGVTQLLNQDMVPLAVQAAFGTLPLAPDLPIGLPMTMTTPKHLGLDDITQIELTTTLFEQWDFRFGGGLSRHAVLGQLEWVRQLHADASLSPEARTALQRAIARLGQVAGWMSFDAGDTPTARRCWLYALYMAGQAGDWPMRVNVLLDMAREAVYHQAPRDALDLMGLAASRSGELTATVKTAVGVVTARAYGALGDEQSCVRAIGAAEETFTRRDLGQDPPWIWYYDEAQLAGDSGHAVFDLAIRGSRIEHAIGLLSLAQALHGSQAPRSRTFALAKLATLHAARREFDLAVTVIEPALTAAPAISSTRLTDDLRALDAILGAADEPPAQELRHRVRSVLSDQ